MDKLLIEGGRPLEGSIRISGAKNSALPAMTAALLTSERVELDNIPRVRDIITMGRLLAHMSAIVETPELPPTAMIIQAGEINGAEAPYELVRTMRASILTLGPLVARTGAARVSLPGGCSIGARPVDLHLKALEQMLLTFLTLFGDMARAFLVVRWWPPDSFNLAHSRVKWSGFSSGRDMARSSTERHVA